MKKTIWKFPLQVEDRQEVLMPSGADILHIGAQSGQVCLWALVDPKFGDKSRTICIYGTGHQTPYDPGKYIGTFMLHDGTLVFHAFEPAS